MLQNSSTAVLTCTCVTRCRPVHVQMRADAACHGSLIAEMLAIRGGKAFVATQALGWALFATALCSLAWLFTQVASGIAYCVQCWVVMTSSIMLAGQLVRSDSPPSAWCH